MTQESIDELIKFKNETKILYTRDGKHKALYLNLSGGFELFQNGKLIKSGMQPYAMIDAYNNLGGHQL